MVAATAARGASRGSLLVEVYDNSPGGGSLGNLSARSRVAGGGGELIAGFVVRGETAATLLVRAVGPSLGNFGLAEALRSPRLKSLGRPDTRCRPCLFRRGIVSWHIVNSTPTWPNVFCPDLFRPYR